MQVTPCVNGSGRSSVGALHICTYVYVYIHIYIYIYIYVQPPLRNFESRREPVSDSRPRRAVEAFIFVAEGFGWEAQGLDWIFLLGAGGFDRAGASCRDEGKWLRTSRRVQVLRKLCFSTFPRQNHVVRSPDIKRNETLSTSQVCAFSLGVLQGPKTCSPCSAIPGSAMSSSTRETPSLGSDIKSYGRAAS